MKRTVVALAVVLFSAAVLAAQEPEVVFRPGDTVRIVVTFKSPVTPEHMQFHFRLRSDVQPAQRGFVREFQGGGSPTKLSDNVYEVTAEIGPLTASGAYQLDFIGITSESVQRDYSLGQDFTKEVTIRIVNPKHVRFPEIEDVKVKP